MQDPSDVPPPPHFCKLRFDGEPIAMGVIMLRNMALSIVTLGLYRFWGRTHMRRYVWQHLCVGADRLHYLGTPKELWLGFLKVCGAFAAVSILASVVGQMQSGLGQLVLPLTLMVAGPYWIYGARSYRMSRTSLRGIRFSMEPGAIWAYVKSAWLLGLVGALSLGLLLPLVNNRLHKFMVDHSSWGVQKFHYDGDDKEVTFLSLRCCLFSLLSLGIYLPWWRAELERYHMAHTTFGTVQMRSHIRGDDLLALWLTNLALFVLSLGLATPWVVQRNLEYRMDQIELLGTMDFAALAAGPVAHGSSFSDNMADDAAWTGFDL